jgi:hypothetical protein
VPVLYLDDCAPAIRQINEKVGPKTCDGRLALEFEPLPFENATDARNASRFRSLRGHEVSGSV